mgnify:CR=1 FL=1
MDLTTMPHTENHHDFQPQRMRVLLVEDSILLRDTIMEILEGAFGLQFDGGEDVLLREQRIAS